MTNKPMTVADVRLMLKGLPYGAAATAPNTESLNRLPGAVAADTTQVGTPTPTAKSTTADTSKAARR